jgi:DNA-binding transcriptional ArsR family regulator
LELSRTDAIAEALADPVRGKVYCAVAEASINSRTGSQPTDGISVRRIAEQIHEPRRRVRHHLEVLRRQGLVDRAREERHSGVIEHYFAVVRPPRLEKPDLTGLSADQQQRIFLGCLRSILASAATALKAGTAVQRPEWAAVRVPVEVDRQGWMELGDLHLRFLEQVEDVAAESQARLRDSKAEAIRAISAFLFFESP